jgi:hypothetical protein
MISGISSIVNVDENNICNIIIENCTPYDVTLERDIDKYDVGLAKDFKHKIHLKTKDPVYRKHFKIPEAHHQLIK